jgi:hypothetical protein
MLRNGKLCCNIEANGNKAINLEVENFFTLKSSLTYSYCRRAKKSCKSNFSFVSICRSVEAQFSISCLISCTLCMDVTLGLVFEKLVVPFLFSET